MTSPRILRLLPIFGLIVILLLVANTSTRAATYDCTAQSDIPQSECEALVALYNSTSGDYWTNHTNWLVTSPCNWFGVTCTNGTVTQLQLSSNFMIGTLPVEIGNLSSLKVLNINHSRVQGALPSSIGNLTALVTLNLSNNQFTGQLPTEIGNLVALTTLNLSSNQFTGQLPPEIGNLTVLTTLNLSSNGITGNLPSATGNLAALVTLDLAGNSFTGSIPASIGNLVALKNLYLQNNQFSGSLPSALGGATSLVIFDVTNNRLEGSLPENIGNLTNLKSLHLEDNYLTGFIPTSIGNLTQLTSLRMAYNRFTGEVPITIANLKNLNQLSLNYNMVTFSNPVVIAFFEAHGHSLTNQLTIPINVGVQYSGFGGIELSWNDPVGTDYNYEVGYATTPGGPYTISDVLWGNSKFVLPSPGSGPIYYFVVRATARRTSGKEPLRTAWSAEVQIQTPLPTETMSPPTVTPNVNVTHEPPPTPIPFYSVSPELGAVITSPNTTFQWITYPYAASYGLRIRDSFDTTLVNVNLAAQQVCNASLCSVDLLAFDVLLENNEAYTWQVRVNNGEVVSGVSSFSTNFAVPSKVTLITPSQGQNVNTMTPVFSWTVSKNATQYRLRVMDSFEQRIINKTFDLTTSPSIMSICNATVCTFDSSILGIPLEHNEDYEWRVRAKNDAGKKNSDPTEFTVLLPVPGAFNLVSPAHDTAVNTVTPILIWQESSGASTYVIKVKDDLDGTLMLKVKNIPSAVCSQGICSLDTSTVSFLSPLKDGDSYDWLVQGRNSFGKKKSNSKWTFDVDLSAQALEALPMPGWGTD